MDPMKTGTVVNKGMDPMKTGTVVNKGMHPMKTGNCGTGNCGKQGHRQGHAPYEDWELW